MSGTDNSIIFRVYAYMSPNYDTDGEKRMTAQEMRTIFKAFIDQCQDRYVIE